MNTVNDDASKKGGTEKIGMELIGDGLDTILAETKVEQRKGSGTGVASPQEVDAVVKGLMQAKKIPITQSNYNRVYLTCCQMVQEGATSPKYAGSRLVTDYGVVIKVDDFRASLKSAGLTARKFARGVKDDVIKVAKTHRLEGNLSKSYKLDFPDYDTQDLPWVSDFQTFSENPAIPERVKNWLLENYRNRFRPGKKPIVDEQLDQ